MQKFSVFDIEAWGKNMLNKYHLLRELDFTKDIDMERSGIYFVHSEKKYLEFVCKVKEQILFNDYISIIGRTHEQEKDVVIIPSNSNLQIFEDSIKRAITLIRKPIKLNEVDIVLISFMVSDFQHDFHIRLCNQDYYNWMCKLKEKTMLYNPDISSRCIAYCFNNKVLSVKSLAGSQISRNNYILLPINDKNIYQILNLKKGFFKANLQSSYVYYNELIQKEDQYLYFSCNRNAKMTINKLIYGNENGYIYLKPLNYDNEKIHILMECSGRPTLEFFCEVSRQWKIIEDNRLLKLNHQVQLRISMHNGDKIYKMFILKDRS
ncbi:hypothetical protein [Petroclostridium xylanilyticum]|uniref:hypothetical protein n=1 Tax=Petroclostridium xylanilyticum TaxID=1792311 RepID=UPI000B97CECD|nr:hypothetical protein [Petroclostridium xylanilyticum]